MQKLGQVEGRRSLLRECFRTVDGRLIFPEHFFRLAGTGALPRELPAHDAQKRFDCWIVEFSLQPYVNGRPTTGADLPVDDSISEFNVLFHIHVVWI